MRTEHDVMFEVGVQDIFLSKTSARNSATNCLYSEENVSAFCRNLDCDVSIICFCGCILQRDTSDNKILNKDGFTLDQKLLSMKSSRLYKQCLKFLKKKG